MLFAIQNVEISKPCQLRLIERGPDLAAKSVPNVTCLHSEPNRPHTRPGECYKQSRLTLARVIRIHTRALNHLVRQNPYPFRRWGAWIGVIGMIDWTRIAELRSEIGEEGFNEVVEIFLEEMEEVIARIRSAPVPETYEADLHFLKGGAWNLGFAHFGSLCSEGERTAAAGRAEEIAIGALLDNYELSKTEFVNGLGPRDSSCISSAA